MTRQIQLSEESLDARHPKTLSKAHRKGFQVKLGLHFHPIEMEQEIARTLAEAGLPSPPPAALRAAVQGNPRADRAIYSSLQAFAQHIDQSQNCLPGKKGNELSISQALALTGSPLAACFVPQADDAGPKGRQLLLAFAWLAEALLELHDYKQHGAQQSEDRVKTAPDSSASPGHHHASKSMRESNIDCSLLKNPHTHTEEDLDIAGHIRAALCAYRELHLDLREHARLQRELVLMVKQRLRNRISLQAQRGPMSVVELLREPVVWKAIRQGTCGGGCLPNPYSNASRRGKGKQARSVWWAWLSAGASTDIPRSISAANSQYPAQRSQASNAQSHVGDTHAHAHAHDRHGCRRVPLAADSGLPAHPTHSLLAAKDGFFVAPQQAAELTAKLQALKQCLSVWEPLLPALRKRAALTGRSGRGLSHLTSAATAPTSTNKYAESVKGGGGMLDAPSSSLNGGSCVFVAAAGFVREDVPQDAGSSAQSTQAPAHCHRTHLGAAEDTLLQQHDAGSDISGLREEQRAILEAAGDFVGAAYGVAYRGF